MYLVDRAEGRRGKVNRGDVDTRNKDGEGLS